MLILVFLAIAAVFNLPKALILYSGYCLEEKRFLSDQEMFDLAAQKIVNEKDLYLSHSYYKVNEDGKKIRVDKNIRNFKYSNIEEFYDMNPNCCKFVSYVQDDGGKHRIHFCKKFTGQINKIVAATYIWGFNKDDDKLVSVIGKFGASNCGDKLWTDLDIRMFYW